MFTVVRYILWIILKGCCVIVRFKSCANKPGFQKIRMGKVVIESSFADEYTDKHMSRLDGN